MGSTEWSAELSEQIGTAIKTWRGNRSDQWISDRTRELGNHVSRTAVSEYRRGVRKSMPVGDLLVIAAALDVPPVALIFPGLPDGEVVALPGKQSTATDAVRWFCGDTVFLTRDYRTETDMGDDTPARQLVSMSRELAKLADQARLVRLRRVKRRARGEATQDETITLEDLATREADLRGEIDKLKAAFNVEG